jgi:hypothetical protein
MAGFGSTRLCAMQSGSDRARTVSYEQHLTFPTREFDNERGDAMEVTQQ